MRLTADGVGVDGPHGALLDPTDVEVGPGEAVLVAGLPGSGHTALALALGGRLVPHRGAVRADGTSGTGAPALLRRRVAIVDTPGVSEPEGALPLRTVVGEELAMAGRRAWRRQVTALLDGRGAGEWARHRFADVPTAVRLDLMLTLAALRPGVEVLVLTNPDRHGGPPRDWWRMARDRADDGYAVVVTCVDASAELLGVPFRRIGGHSEPEGSS